MTSEKPDRFEALYRVERDGTHTWVLQLENDQMVTVNDVDIRLYRNRESMVNNVGDPIGIIMRKVETDAQAETGDAKPGRLF